MRRGKEKCIPLLFFFFQRVKEESWLSYRLCAHGTVSGWADPQNGRLLRQGHLSEPLEFKGKNLIFKETKAGRQACTARKAPALSPLRPARLVPISTHIPLGAHLTSSQLPGLRAHLPDSQRPTWGSRKRPPISSSSRLPTPFPASQQLRRGNWNEGVMPNKRGKSEWRSGLLNPLVVARKKDGTGARVRTSWEGSWGAAGPAQGWVPWRGKSRQGHCVCVYCIISSLSSLNS